jgi:ketosteroid isomerase-like protein
MSEQNVDKVRKGIEDFNRRDFDGALVHVAEDVIWEPFLSRTETQLLKGIEQVRAAWQRQVEAVDLRGEPQEFLAVGSDKVVVPMRLTAHGKGSEMSLDAWVVWVWTLEDGIVTRVQVFDTRDDALQDAGQSEKA